MIEGIGTVLFIIFYLSGRNFIGHFIAFKMFQSEIAPNLFRGIKITYVNIILVVYLCVNIALIPNVFPSFQIFIGKFIKTLTRLWSQIHTENERCNTN